MRIKKSITYLFILCLMFLLFGMSTEAASKNAKIYKKFLKKRSTSVTINGSNGKYKQKVKMNYFVLINIDKSGPKELIVKNTEYDWDNYVFTIKNGKVKFLGRVAGKYNSGRVLYNAKYKGLVGRDGGTGFLLHSLYKLKNGKLNESIHIWENHNLSDTFAVNNKNCSKKTFNKYYNKYFKASKLKSYAFVTNKKANRSRLLK